MESALPSASESGLGEADDSAIYVGVGAKVKKRKPQSKYTDEDRDKIAKYAKGRRKDLSLENIKTTPMWRRSILQRLVFCECF